MKRIVLTIMFAAFAFAANAQFVIGGQIGFNTNGGDAWYSNTAGNTTTDYHQPSNVHTNFTIAPKFGYNLNEQMHVGVVLGFTSRVTKDYEDFLTFYRTNKDFQGWYKYTTNSFFFAPYFRYTFLTFNRLSCFAEAQIALMYAPQTKTHYYNTRVAGIIDKHDTIIPDNTTTTTFAITVVPGVNYRFSNHFSADLYIDLLGIAYTSSTVHYKNTVAGVTTESKGTRSDFRCVASFNAESLADHLNLFRLGFNYHF